MTMALVRLIVTSASVLVAYLTIRVVVDLTLHGARLIRERRECRDETT